MDKLIAHQIALAQRASDIGKWHSLAHLEKRLSGTIGTLLGDDDSNAKRDGYALKDKAIVKAIELIRRGGKECGFRFFVTRCDDFNSPCFIVYFDFKIEGTRRQVSFHTFNKVVARYLKGCVNSKGHWNDTNSSRKTCLDLLHSTV